MKTSNLYVLVLIIALFGGLTSCKDNIIPIDGNAPEISFVFDTLVADLNQSTNAPIVAVINSEVGLATVEMFIEKSNGESVLFKNIDTFFDSKRYTLTERLTYEENFQYFKLVVTDIAKKKATIQIPFKIIGYKNAPIIEFEYPEIVISELNGDITPRTKFSVTSSSDLKSLVVSKYFKVGTPQVLLTENFTELSQSIKTYSFDDIIEYNENVTALQVTAIDIYGKSRIATLPIHYTSIPVPTIANVIPSKFLVNLNGQSNISFKAESMAGIKQIKLISMHKSVESADLFVDNYPSFDKSITYSKSVTFNDDAMSGIKVVVIDINDKKIEKIISAFVGLDFLEDQWLGSQFYTRGIPEEPGIYGMYSLKSKKGISIYDAYNSPADVDFLFYMYDSSKGIAAARFLSPLLLTDAGRYKNGPWYIDLLHTPSIPYFDSWIGLNNTKYVQLNSASLGFTFDDVTLNDLNKILKSTISLERLRGTTVAAEKIEPGYVYLFKTGINSSAGSEKIGLFKIEELYYVSTIPEVTQPWGAAGKAADVGKLRISIKMPK